MNPTVNISPSPQAGNAVEGAVPTEPRWPLVIAIFAVLMLFAFIPDRVSLLPTWSALAIAIFFILLMVTVWFSGNRGSWLRIERRAMLALSIALLALTLITVVYLVIEIMDRPARLTGQQLLSTGIGAWVTNVLAFSIVYWDIDRNGPEARTSKSSTLPDWLFPQESVPNEVPLGWRPTYVDYLFLAFSTATAFSTTDVLPLTIRAKLLMMLESLISLATLAIVASRAINILGN